MATYVLVHGAWHTGELLEDVAGPIRAAGHEVHTPTLAGNRPGDAKDGDLDAAVDSLIAYCDETGVDDAIFMGHSYGGMVITALADRMAPGRVRRLVYWSAFVPHDGEALVDLIPDPVRELFAASAQPDGSLVIPEPLWREAFMNDADAELSHATFQKLNPHPYGTFTQKARLRSAPAEWQVGKSYIHCQEDVALPASMPWHPRLSERLGLFRYVWMPGGHEVCFTNPALLAEKIIQAGRD